MVIFGTLSDIAENQALERFEPADFKNMLIILLILRVITEIGLNFWTFKLNCCNSGYKISIMRYYMSDKKFIRRSMALKWR